MAIIRQDYGTLSGGGGATLLWENSGTSVPSPITIDNLTSYTHLIFYFAPGDGAANDWCMQPTDKSNGFISGDIMGADSYLVCRNYSISGNIVSFNTSTSYEWRIGTSSIWTNNSYAIPLKIYGIKLD